MPTVRNYQLQVETRAVPAVRRSTAPTADMLGANIGDRIQRIGAQMYEEEVYRQDQVAVLEADRKLSEWETKRLYDPREGVYAKRGKDAFGLPDAIEADFAKTTDEIRATLTSDRQRAAFDRQAITRRTDIGRNVSRHVLSEVRKYDDAETENYLTNARQAAIGAAATGDLGRVATENERQQSAIVDYAQRNGLGPEFIKQKLGRAKSDTHVAVVDTLLAQGNDLSAQAYVAQVRGELVGDDIAKVDKWLQEGTIRGESQRQTDTILGKATTLTEAMELAKGIRDPKVRDATEDRIREGFVIRREAEREQRETTMREAADVIDKTGSVRRIPPSKWMSLSPQERATLEAYAKRHQTAAAGPAVKTDMATFYELTTLASSPATREAFAKTNLLMYVNKLSTTDFKSLAEAQAKIRTGDDKAATKLLSNQAVQNQIVSDAALSMGLDPTPTEKTSKPDRERVLEFRRVVRERVAELETRTGRNATDEEVQRLVDNLVVKGTVPGSGWFIDDTKHAFEMKEGENLVIKPADVPSAERRKIEEAFKRKGLGFTDQDIVNVYTQKLRGR